MDYVGATLKGAELPEVRLFLSKDTRVDEIVPRLGNHYPSIVSRGNT